MAVLETSPEKCPEGYKHFKRNIIYLDIHLFKEFFLSTYYVPATKNIAES